MAKRRRKLSDDRVSKAVEMRREGKSVSAIARELGIHHSTVTRALAEYQPQGGMVGEPPTDMAFDELIDTSDINGEVHVLKQDRLLKPEELMKMSGLDRHVWIPQNFKVTAGQSFHKIKVLGPDGWGSKKVNLFWSKLHCKRVVTEEVEDAIVRFTKKYVKPIPKPKLTNPRKKDDREPFAITWGLWDTHIGMYAWNSEVGADFDVDIACNRVMNSIDDIVRELQLYNIEKVFMPIGNDFMHFDSVKHTTTMGDHFLDTDTRYARVYEAALSCLSYMVERALEICGDLDLFYIPGNHDYTSSFCLTSALRQRYRLDRRVKVDIGPNPRKIRTYGGCLLGFDHGKMKTTKWPMLFSTEAHKEWSASTYREVQVGHTHQRKETQYDGVLPTNGLLVRVNPTLCNTDSWHHGHGLIGEPVKSVEVWRYDKVAYRGSHVAWARDETHETAKRALKSRFQDTCSSSSPRKSKRSR